MKDKFERFKQWTREHATEIVVWSTAGGAVATVVYGAYASYKTGKYYDSQMSLMRESYEDFKQHRDAGGE